MRKKKHEEHANHERWLVSYADFITLLFAFFVVMFAVSQVDSQKMGRFVESVNVAFEYRGVFPESSGLPIPMQGGPAMASMRPSIAPPKLDFAGAHSLSRRGNDVKKAVESMIDRAGLGGKVRVRSDRRGVTVSLTEACFFDPGSAVVRDQARETLRAIGEVLRDTKVPLVVEGHTDSVPIRTALFRSNWELSTARATTILAYLIDDLKFDPARMAAAGYGEYRPIAVNTTPEGRAQNRRVDLVVLTESVDAPAPEALDFRQLSSVDPATLPL